MGKSSRRRNGKGKGKQRAGGGSSGASSARRAAKKALYASGGIFKALSSHEASERAATCVAVSNLSLSALKSSEREGVYRAMLPRLVDDSVEVREQAFGALRALSISGGDEACGEMVKADVLTPSIAIFGSNIDPLISCAVVDQESDTGAGIRAAINAIEFLYNLCEGAPDVPGKIAGSAVVAASVEFALRAACGELNTSAARLLHVCSEHLPMQEILAEKQFFSRVRSTLASADASSVLRTVNLCGVIVNCILRDARCDGNDASDLETSCSVVLSTLKRALQIESPAFWTQGGDDSSDAWRQCCKAQMLAMEIIANFCSLSESGTHKYVCQQVVEQGFLGALEKVLAACSSVSDNGGKSAESNAVKQRVWIFATQQRAAGCIDNIVQNESQGLVFDARYFAFCPFAGSVMVWMRQALVSGTLAAFGAADAFAALLHSMLRRASMDQNNKAIEVVVRELCTEASMTTLYQASEGAQSPHMRASCVAMLSILAQSSLLQSAQREDIASRILKATSDPSDEVLADA